MADFAIKRGDTRDAIAAIPYDPDGTIPDLTNATITFLMRLRGTSTNKVAATAAYNATTKQMYYAFESADVDTIGTYDAEFRVEFTDHRKTTYPRPNYISVLIEQSFA